jgi:hypothetical protein
MAIMRRTIVGVVICAVAFSINALAQNTFPPGGNVGIGTTAPGFPLQVLGSSAAPNNGGTLGTLFIGSSGAAVGVGYYNLNYSWIQGYGALPLYIDPLGNNTILNATAGNVGIGTTGPAQLLQVGASYSQNPTIMVGGIDSNNSSTGHFALLFGAFRDVETIESGIVATPTWTCCGGYPTSGYAGIRVNSLGFYTEYDASNPTNYSPNMLINTNGYVGIGTSSPGALLEVNGNVKLTAGSGASITFQDGSVQSTAYTGVTCGGDYAESVDVTGNRTQYEPGDVLVLDTENPGRVLKSVEAYSTAVSGIYSTKPGVVGRRQTSDPKTTKTEVPMAMVGVVPTKVSAENGAIKVGDLLVSSSTIGYAMKGTDRSKMLGAVIGKAMGNLNAGMGVIEVLVTLQ